MNDNDAAATTSPISVFTAGATANDASMQAEVSLRDK